MRRFLAFMSNTLSNWGNLHVDARLKGTEPSRRAVPMRKLTLRSAAAAGLLLLAAGLPAASCL
ncbi:MAG: hypothetical protein ACYTGB_02375, partial [Planctomycetota bacterium]